MAIKEMRSLNFGGPDTYVPVPTDWNQNDETQPDFLKNKPFGDSPTGGDTLTWDGNTEGLKSVFVEAEDIYLYKISDVAPTLEDAQKGGFVRAFGNEEAFTSEHIQTLNDSIFVIMSPEFFIIITEDNVEMFGVTVPEKGIYTMVDIELGVTIHGYTGFPGVNIIDDKYLPDSVFLYKDDNYLYNYPNTANEANKTTKVQLMEHVKSGSPVYLYEKVLDLDVFYPANAFTFDDVCGAILLYTSTGETKTYHTAEYTPTT